MLPWKKITDVAPLRDGTEYLLGWFEQNGEWSCEVGRWGNGHSDNEGWIEGRDLVLLPATHYVEITSPEI